MEELIVIAIIATAAACIGRSFYKKLTSAATGGCEGGCSSCPPGASRACLPCKSPTAARCDRR